MQPFETIIFFPIEEQELFFTSWNPKISRAVTYASEAQSQNGFFAPRNLGFCWRKIEKNRSSVVDCETDACVEGHVRKIIIKLGLTN